MTCQSHHCAQGRQPCPTPFDCRHACTTLQTRNSDGSNAHGQAKATPKRTRTDAISLFFLTLACAGGLVAVFAMLAGLLSVKLA